MSKQELNRLIEATKNPDNLDTRTTCVFCGKKYGISLGFHGFTGICDVCWAEWYPQDQEVVR